MINDPAEILTISNEDLTKLYWETVDDENKLKDLMEDVIAQKAAIKKEFIARTVKLNRDAIIVADTSITVYSKLYTNGVSLETAALFGATKTELKVDSQRIAKIMEMGTEVVGAEKRTEVRVSKIKAKETV